MSTPRPPTEFQEKCVKAIRELHPWANLDAIARKVRSNRLAVNAALRGLRTRGLADYTRWPHDDVWARQFWHLK